MGEGTCFPAIAKLESHLAWSADIAFRPTSGNGLEALTRDRQWQHAIRINDQYRLCFRWTPQGPADVEIVDYH